MLSGNPPKQRDGNAGFYVLLDQMVFGDARTIPLQGLWPFVSVLIAPSEAYNKMPLFVNGGLVYYGLIPRRDDDVALFGVVWGEFSSDLRRSQRDAGEPAQGSELVFEWAYNVQLAPWLHVQPDVQWVIRPGATNRIPDAVVLGTQIAVNF